MGSKESIDVVMQLDDALREQDFARMHELFAEDAVTRMAGMPAILGGACKGRDMILDYLHHAPRGPFEVRGVFGDDEHVCVTGKWNVKTFPGRGVLRAGGQGFTTWEADIYRVKDGRITEAVSYINWLDAYVQMGIVDIGQLG
jgi:ketosteroid isomerase-like protein